MIQGKAKKIRGKLKSETYINVNHIMDRNLTTLKWKSFKCNYLVMNSVKMKNMLFIKGHSKCFVTGADNTPVS